MKNDFTTITGHVGRNPVLYHRNTKNGRQPVAKFSVAVNSIVDGERVTKWYQASAWDKKSGIAMRNLRKGTTVQLFGFAKLDKYTNRKGEYVESLAFNAQYIDILSNPAKKAVQNAVADGNNAGFPTQARLPGV